MKLSSVELTAALVLCAVVAYSAGSVAARDAGAAAAVSGDWQARFTVDHAYPHAGRAAAGQAMAARLHIDAALPSPARSGTAPPPDALDGDLAVFGMRGHALRGVEVHPARGDSVEVTLGSGEHTLVLTGKPTCDRVTGHWWRESRVETETGHFELRRGTPPRDAAYSSGGQTG